MGLEASTTHLVAPSSFPKDHRHVLNPSFLNWWPAYLLCERLNAILLVAWTFLLHLSRRNIAEKTQAQDFWLRSTLITLKRKSFVLASCTPRLESSQVDYVEEAY